MIWICKNKITRSLTFEFLYLQSKIINEGNQNVTSCYLILIEAICPH